MSKRKFTNLSKSSLKMKRKESEMSFIFLKKKNAYT